MAINSVWQWVSFQLRSVYCIQSAGQLTIPYPGIHAGGSYVSTIQSSMTLALNFCSKRTGFGVKSLKYYRVYS